MKIAYKTLTFAVTHFIVAFSVTFLITGSWVLGGLIALIEPAVNTVAYLVHEKVWEKVGKNRPSNSVERQSESPRRALYHHGIRYFGEYVR